MMCPVPTGTGGQVTELRILPLMLESVGYTKARWSLQKSHRPSGALALLPRQL